MLSKKRILSVLVIVAVLGMITLPINAFAYGEGQNQKASGNDNDVQPFKNDPGGGGGSTSQSPAALLKSGYTLPSKNKKGNTKSDIENAGTLSSIIMAPLMYVSIGTGAATLIYSKTGKNQYYHEWCYMKPGTRKQGCVVKFYSNSSRNPNSLITVKTGYGKVKD